MKELALVPKGAAASGIFGPDVGVFPTDGPIGMRGARTRFLLVAGQSVGFAPVVDLDLYTLSLVLVLTPMHRRTGVLAKSLTSLAARGVSIKGISTRPSRAPNGDALPSTYSFWMYLGVSGADPMSVDCAVREIVLEGVAVKSLGWILSERLDEPRRIEAPPGSVYPRYISDSRFPNVDEVALERLLEWPLWMGKWNNDD